MRVLLVENAWDRRFESRGKVIGRHADRLRQKINRGVGAMLRSPR